MNANDPSNLPNADERPESHIGPVLSADDARILDLLVEARFDLTALPPLSTTDHQRAQRLVAQFGLLDVYPEGDAFTTDADALLDATMARIDRDDDARTNRMRLDPDRDMVVRRRFRFPDLIAVASIAILAAVILVPLVNWRNARALDLKCDNNMRLIAQGLENYGRAFSGAMPMAATLVPDLSSWLGYRNADNLNPLKAGHYCSDACLCCPGDHDPNGSYAYQVSIGERQPRWQEGPRVAVIGDRNPLVDLKRNGETIASVALNSASHGGRGQNILFSDGAINFANSPFLPWEGATSAAGSRGIDNIWLPFGDRADSLSQSPVGPAGPGSGVDAFLLH
jgi:type II secretory pathway pseudopilin PulG